MRDFFLDRQKATDFERWARLKAEIHFFQDESKFYFQVREIWWASLGINIGHEQDGKNDQYERPVLILKKFNRKIVLAVPLSSRLKQGRYYHRVFFDNKFRNIILSQLRLLSVRRLIRKVGSLGPEDFQKVREEIKSLF